MEVVPFDAGAVSLRHAGLVVHGPGGVAPCVLVPLVEPLVGDGVLDEPFAVFGTDGVLMAPPAHGPDPAFQIQATMPSQHGADPGVQAFDAVVGRGHVPEPEEGEHLVLDDEPAQHAPRLGETLVRVAFAPVGAAAALVDERVPSGLPPQPFHAPFVDRLPVVRPGQFDRQIPQLPGRLVAGMLAGQLGDVCFASMSFQQAHQYFSAVWADGFPRSRHHAVSDVR